MQDGEWRLDYPGVSMLWGKGYAGAPYSLYNFTYPDLGDRPFASVDDAARPRADGQLFGQDFLGGPTYTFQVQIVAASESVALQAIEDVSTAWRADALRRTNGAVATLSTQNAGRERFTRGRPRRFSPQHDLKRKSGALVAQLDFMCADDLWYDAQLESLSVPFVASDTGGFTMPFTSPLTTAATATSLGSLIIGGTKDVWPTIVINGPITNPVVRIVNQWTLTLNTSLLAGQSLIIDTREQSVVRVSDGASYGGALTPASRLDRSTLAPGSYAAQLTGIDATGTSSMQITWRKTYAHF